MGSQLERDFERFKRELPGDFSDHVRETYGIDLTARYLGATIPHPIGKGSGQLSLNQNQLADDARAGLAFVVLKTLIAEDEAGSQSMAAWAIHETKMQVERRHAAGGRPGWTVTWKGRGWDRALEDYLALVRAGRDLTRAGRLLVVPSVKYHLPRLEEPFRDGEYRYTTRLLADAWGDDVPPLLVEKDFSPTLAGDSLAGDRDQIMRWLREVPGRIRAASPISVRVAVKLMNACFDDAFQLEMIDACRDADMLVCFNRLFDADRNVAYGGPGPRRAPGAMRDGQHLLGPHDRRICSARLRERAAPHLLPAPAVGIRRDARVAHPAGAPRAAVRSARWPRRRVARARGDGSARAPRRCLALPRPRGRCTSPGLSCSS